MAVRWIKSLIVTMLAREPLPENAVLIDVRSEAECTRGYIKGSLLIPVAQISNQQDRIKESASVDTPLVVYCASGGRAVRASKTLRKMGYQTVVNGGSVEKVAKQLGKSIIS